MARIHDDERGSISLQIVQFLLLYVIVIKTHTQTQPQQPRKLDTCQFGTLRSFLPRSLRVHKRKPQHTSINVNKSDSFLSISEPSYRIFLIFFPHSSSLLSSIPLLLSVCIYIYIYRRTFSSVPRLCIITIVLKRHLAHRFFCYLASIRNRS